MKVAFKASLIVAALTCSSTFAAMNSETIEPAAVRFDAAPLSQVIISREGSSGGHRQRRGGEGGNVIDSGAKTADVIAREAESGGHRQRRGRGADDRRVIEDGATDVLAKFAKSKYQG